MASFLFRAELDPSKLDVREAIRPEHLAYQSRFGNLAGGPLSAVDGTPTGSMIIMEADSLDDAHARIAADPYVTAGVFASWTLDRVELAVWSSGPSDPT